MQRVFAMEFQPEEAAEEEMILGNVVATATPELVLEMLTVSERSVWIGSLSFEERCCGSLSQLSRSGARLTHGYLIRYGTNVQPQYEDIRRRSAHLGELNRLAQNVFLNDLQLVDAEPYSFEHCSEAFDKIILESDPTLLVCDITCLTKIHALALAAAVYRNARTRRCAVVHSIPENYLIGDESGKGTGWRDVIVAPLAATATLFNESRSRGIILLGHESDRLIVALAELEPAGGVILLATTAQRPDLRRISQRFNQKIIRHLTRMRSHTWRTETLDISDMEGLRRSVSSEIVLAKDFAAPVILFPYGPKPLLFLSALQLCAEYPEASWFVYPVPASYDVNYTEGTQGCIWVTPAAAARKHLL